MKDKIQELNKLIEENPDMLVKLFVGIDAICDDYFYTEQHIVSVKLSGWFQIDEHIYTDEDELSEYYIDNFELSDDEARVKAFENLVDVILIKTGV